MCGLDSEKWIDQSVDGLLKNEDKLKQMALACGNDKKDSALEIVQILDHMLESNTN